MSHTHDLESQLKTLPPSTTAARFRSIAPTILELLENGVSRQAIVEKLNQNGFDNLKLKTFDSYLYRYRKSLRDAGHGEKTEKAKPVSSNNLPGEKEEVAPEEKESNLESGYQNGETTASKKLTTAKDLKRLREKPRIDFSELAHDSNEEGED